MAAPEANALLVTVIAPRASPGTAEGWLLLDWHPLHATHDAPTASAAATHALALAQLPRCPRTSKGSTTMRSRGVGLVVRLVHDGLRSVAEVEAVEAGAVEGDRAEEVPRHAPGRRAPEEAPHGPRPHGEHHEEQRRVVVREAVAELAPARVLV